MKVAFLILPNVEMLDLAGPLQVFKEAKDAGLEVDVAYYSWSSNITTAAGIGFEGLSHYSKGELNQGDFLLIPGLHLESYSREEKKEGSLFKWLQYLNNRNVSIAAICTGAFILGEAGLLNNIECTTHWRSVSLLQQMYPEAKVVDDVLFVRSGNIMTSAGISSGIDMALDIIEGLKGPVFTQHVARGLVLYQRRNGLQKQVSIYLDFRNHISPKIHLLQDYLINNLHKETSIEVLSEVALMSPRNLTRVFKQNTGVTIAEYITKLRLEKAQTLLNDPSLTREAIAAACGFQSVRQLQRILKM